MLYQSFDNSDCLILWEGTQDIGDVPLVSGKVRFKIFAIDLCLCYGIFGE